MKIVCKNGTLQVIINIPLLDVAEYTLYEMHAPPLHQPIFGNGTGRAFIQTPVTHIVIEDTRRTYMLLIRPNRSLCRDLQNYIMCPGLFPIYETATYPRCELQLLLDPTPASFKLCNIQVSCEQLPYWQAIRSLNGWLYSTTKEIGVEIKCITKQTINIKINGLVLIRISLGCEL